MDYATYYHTYQTVLAGGLSFPDVQAALRVGRQHGKIASQVMQHVVQWLGPRCSTEAERNDSKQPVLWKELIPAFGDKLVRNRLARSLQRQVLDIIRARMDEFIDGPAGPYLSRLPAGGKDDAYLDRFKCPAWKDVLVKVYSCAEVHLETGARFQGPLARFNTEDPTDVPTQQETTTLVRAFGDAISHIPAVARNPALRESSALNVLLNQISPLVMSWALQQCREALEAQSLGRAPLWPPSVREMVMCQQSELDSGQSTSSQTNGDTSLRSTPPSTSPSVRSRSAPSEKYDGESAVEDLAAEEPPLSDGSPDLVVEEIRKAKSLSASLLLDPAEAKKRRGQHRQTHPARRPTPNKHQNFQVVDEVAQPRRGEAPQTSQVSRHPATSQVPPGSALQKKSLPSWRHSPAAKVALRG
jgi:hypothetical protein